jgi:CHRD domain
MRSLISIAVLGAVALAGCSRSSSDTPTTEPEPVGFLGAQWTANLNPPANSPSPNAAGTATVAGNTDGTQTRVEVNLTGAPPSGDLPWHLHRGTCGNDQGIVGESTKYPPLSVGMDGKASGSATLDVPTPKAGEYMINVHASATDLGTIIACGNLSGPTGQ